MHRSAENGSKIVGDDDVIGTVIRNRTFTPPERKLHDANTSQMPRGMISGLWRVQRRRLSGEQFLRRALGRDYGSRGRRRGAGYLARLGR